MLSAFASIWNYLKITTFFTICRLRWKFVFVDVVTSIQSLSSNKREEICMQSSAKGFLVMKDAKNMDTPAYSDCISAPALIKSIHLSHDILYTIPVLFFSCRYSMLA